MYYYIILALALQGIIGFGRAILSDTPLIKGASFATANTVLKPVM
jgi:hypothetical protein